MAGEPAPEQVEDGVFHVREIMERGKGILSGVGVRLDPRDNSAIQAMSAPFTLK
jgi:hypothetical protein